MEKVLMILEVGQKQSFIFENKEVRKNILNSNLIRWATDVRYFMEAMADSHKLFDEEACLVYTGGGHTVLEFQDINEAREFSRIITRYTQKNLNGLEIYVKIHKYEETRTPGENLNILTEGLEHKKEIRAASFHQGSFGIEELDANTKKPKRYKETEYHNKSHGFAEMEKILTRSMAPERYGLVSRFEDMGNAKGESSFIAVVHIDGNSMGKRVKDIREKLDRECMDWKEYKIELRKFSDSIDQDFQNAYKEMVLEIEKELDNNPVISNALNMESNNFPVRRIITAGDDICFVTEGRIGLESAAIFLKKLKGKMNSVDKEPYAACAGVAIVHTKYPFFKAYELAERLCGNAKDLAASQSWGEGSFSAMDWHIEFGEVKDSLGKIRMDYLNREGTHLEQRPYLVTGAEEALKVNPFRNYGNFRKLVKMFQDEKISYANGKLKEFCEILKQTEAEAEYYLKSNLIHDLTMAGYQDVYVEMDMSRLFSGQALDRKLFYEEEEPGGKSIRRCLCFDALELFDSCILLEEG